MSAKGKKLSSASRIVTCDPSLFQILATSKPITPAPITAKSLGTSEKFRASFEETICTLPSSILGKLIGLDPVAIIIFFASNSLSVPSSKATRTLPFEIKEAQPCSDSTLFNLNKPLTPFVRL